MDTPEGGELRPKIDPWELDLIAAFVRRVRATASEHEEFQAELSREWLIQRIRMPVGIRNLEAYLKGFLRHKIADWRRERRLERERQVSLDSPTTLDAEGPLTLEHVLASSERDQDLQIDVRNLLKKLDSRLRSVLLVLAEERGNQSRAARRLGCHRNTIGALLSKIRETAARHGFRVPRTFSRLASHQPSRNRPRAEPVIKTDAGIIERMSGRASGTSWRVLLWIIKESARRKQRSVPFTWYRIAQQVCLDRGNVYRAGMKLIKKGLVTVENGKISLMRGRPERGQGR